MMKKNIIKNIFFVAILLSTSKILSQIPIIPHPFKNFEANKSIGDYDLGEIIHDLKPINGDRFIYSMYFVQAFGNTPPNEDYLMLTDSIRGRLKILDYNLSVIKNKPLKFLELDGKLRGAYFLCIDSSNLGEQRIIVLGSGQNLQISGNPFFELVLDENLELLSEKWFPLPIDNIVVIYKVLRNKFNNFVVVGDRNQVNPQNPNQVERFICEFNNDGEIIHFYAPIRIPNDFWGFTEGALLEMDSHYVSLPDLIFNKSLIPVDTFFNPFLVPTGKIVKLDENRFVFGGVRQNLIGPQPLTYATVIISDLQGNLDTILNSSYVGELSKSTPGIRSLAAADTNHIYFATSKGGWFQEQSNFVTLNCLNSQGGMNWSYSFGGDASYTPIDIITFSDKSCLLTAWKFITSPNLPDFQTCDIVYVKFDTLGNIISSTGLNDISQNQREYNFAFPNPFSDYICFDTHPDFMGSNLLIFDMAGKLVYHKETQENCITTNNWSSGIYYYKLFDKKNTLKTGKIIKIKD